MTRKLVVIGYWAEPESDEDYIDPNHLIEADYPLSLKKKIIKYLNDGLVVSEELGYSFCRFKDGPPDEEMGCTEKTDGFWVWPEGLVVYVDKYNIPLPEEFLDHMKKNSFSIPKEIYNQDFSDIYWDVNFWIDWGKRVEKKTRVEKKKWWSALFERTFR